MSKIRVFADTNVIIESFRTNCWTAITTHFYFETVEKCVEEVLSGSPDDPRYVTVPPAELHAGLSSRHPVTRKELAALVMHPSCTTLDDGEKHLWAWLLANKLLPSKAILVTTADKAALIAANSLGWIDCVTSLEALARTAGVARVALDALGKQYREDWLSSVRIKIRLGVIP